MAEIKITLNFGPQHPAARSCAWCSSSTAKLSNAQIRTSVCCIGLLKSWPKAERISSRFPTWIGWDTYDNANEHVLLAWRKLLGIEVPIRAHTSSCTPKSPVC